MDSASYTAGSDDALLALGFEKTAFLSAMLAAGRTLIPRAVPKLLGSVGATAGRFGTGIERAVASGAGSLLGKPGATVARTLIKGVPGRMGRDALIGAGLGGAIEGGINAYTAEPGNRGSAFMKGFGHGALTGAAGGAIMGGASGLIDNVGASALRQQAARVGLRGAKATSAAQAAGQRGFFGNVKDIFSRTAPEHGLGRRAAAINLAGTAAGLGTILMPTPTFSDEKTAEDALDIPEELPVVDAGSSPNSEDWRRYLLNPHTVAMMAGTGLGAAGTNVALDLLERQGHLPERSLQRILATRIAPVPGSILGATAGHYLGTKLTENDV